MVAYKSLDHNGHNLTSLAHGNLEIFKPTLCIFDFLLFSNCFIQAKSHGILRKNPVLPIKKFLPLVLPRNAIMLCTTPCSPIFAPLSGFFQEVINERIFQTFSSKSGWGHFGKVECRALTERFRIQVKWIDFS